MNRCEAAGAKPHVYKQVDGRDLTLYVTVPEGHQPTDTRPAMVFYHGGGWVGGAPGQFTEHAKYLAGRGMVCVQVEYRLLNRKGTEPPDVCIMDAKSALRWVRAHAPELGIDPKRIAAGGGSAGGHLAAATAFLTSCNDPHDDPAVDPKPNALVLFNPVYNNGPDAGWGQARVGNRHQELSPAHNVTPGAPPTLVFLGSRDKLIPVAVAEKFRADMRAAGDRSELIVYEGQGHGFFNHRGADGGAYFRRTVVEMDRFLASLGYTTGQPTLQLLPGDEQ